MPTCFVMQPFDGDVFDRRYRDVVEPAIKAGGLEPYRVDTDPTVSIPIEEIENGIRAAPVCLAEITTDNPNVWFELGFAIASGKQVVLICSDERKSKYPFDVQHRSIIKYSTGSTSDFERLRSAISERISSYLTKAETLSAATSVSKLAKVDGLAQHEVVALAAIAANLEHPEDHASVFQIKRDMEASGFTKVAATLAMRGLASHGLIQHGKFTSEEPYGGTYDGFSLTDGGWKWVLENKDKFELRNEPPPPQPIW